MSLNLPTVKLTTDIYFKNLILKIPTKGGLFFSFFEMENNDLKP